MELDHLSIHNARQALDAKDYSATELAQAHLGAIKAKDETLHAYLEVYDDVLDQAARADERIAKGESTALLGIPLALKDNILREGFIASSASKMLEHYRASYSATVVQRLEAAGAVFLGRTNMDEFALGSSTEQSAFGPTKNPRDIGRVPGGSSGGSAATVAADMALAALGSDTGGSVRQPASLCGVVGLKTTYGRVSRYGLMAAASSLDQIGPLAKTVADAKVVFDAIQGKDPLDGTTVPDGFYKVSPEVKKIGVPRAFLTEGIDARVRDSFESMLQTLASQGYEVVDIELPHAGAALAAYYIINPAEVSTNLARFDGIRYGLSIDAPTVQEINELSRAAGFGPEVRRRILIGTFELSSGYVDAYYRKAEVVRRMLRDDYTNAFKEVDIIATPTAPTPAFALGEKADPLSMYAADIFTVPINLAGVPAISVPIAPAVEGDKKLPVGMQFIGPHGGEEKLFTIGAAVEATTPYN